MEQYNVIIGVDPGFSGGITIFEKDKTPVVYKIPITKMKNSTGRVKSTYDLSLIYSYLKPYVGKKVLFCIENVSVRPLEGAVSAFSFGRGIGQLEGISWGLGFVLERISPMIWKKTFDDLETPIIKQLRIDATNLKKVNKNNPNLENKKENKKIIDKWRKQIKEEAKTAARELAGKLYPDLAQEFTLKNEDGKAESLLIALHAIKRTKNKIDFV